MNPTEDRQQGALGGVMSRLDVRSTTARRIIVFGVTSLYVLSFGPLHRALGDSAAILVTFPVLVAALLFGARAGLLTGAISFPLNALLIAFVPNQSWLEWSTSGGVVGACAEMLVGGLVGRLRDLSVRAQSEMSGRLRAEAERAVYLAQLQHLSRRLLHTQEDERRRIVRELHDEFGQTLTALDITIESMAQYGAEAADARFQNLHDMIATLQGRIQDLSLDLRPSMLDALGLPPALTLLFSRTQAESGLGVRFDHNLGETRFRAELETAAYRIVQEALTNVVRYSGVREAQVTINADKTGLHVVVQDRGVGFDFDATATSALTGGVVGMRERAMSLGGQLSLESKPGEGTCVAAVLPCDPLPKD